MKNESVPRDTLGTLVVCLWARAGLSVLRQQPHLKHVACQSLNPPKSSPWIDNYTEIAPDLHTHRVKVRRSISQQSDTFHVPFNDRTHHSQLGTRIAASTPHSILTFILSYSASPVGDSRSFPSTGFILPQDAVARSPQSGLFL